MVSTERIQKELGRSDNKDEMSAVRFVLEKMFLKSSFGRNFLEVGNGLPIQMNSQIMVNIWYQSSKVHPNHNGAL